MCWQRRSRLWWRHKPLWDFLQHLHEFGGEAESSELGGDRQSGDVAVPLLPGHGSLRLPHDCKTGDTLTVLRAERGTKPPKKRAEHHNKSIIDRLGIRFLKLLINWLLLLLAAGDEACDSSICNYYLHNFFCCPELKKLHTLNINKRFHIYEIVYFKMYLY